MLDPRECGHPVTVPIDLLNGEVVGHLCAGCWASLPLEWGCEDCTWVEDRQFGSPVTRLHLGRSCGSHRYPEWAL